MSSGEEPARRIFANLDCEADFAAAASARGRARGTLPGRVLRTIAGAGTLLRAFAREGDRLCLPAAIEPAAMATVPGLPKPRLETYRRTDAGREDEILAWGETDEIRQLRRGGSPPRSPQDWSALMQLPLPDRLWRLPAPSPAAAAAVNDRAFCLEVARELDCQLPGARRIATLHELDAHLASGGAGAATHGGWVLKARFSAAGRWRYIHSPGSAIDRRRIDRLLARHGDLLFEPWMERLEDLGVSAALTPAGWRVFGHHRQLLDRRGRFLGIEVVVGPQAPEPWLGAHDRDRLEEVLSGVAEALSRAKYRGPFGIDAWRYRRADGTVALNPLGEINGRMTFGLLTRALVDRLRGPFGWAPDTRIRLVFEEPTGEERGEATVPLLHPTQPADRAIWLEIQPA